MRVGGVQDETPREKKERGSTTQNSDSGISI